MFTPVFSCTSEECIAISRREGKGQLYFFWYGSLNWPSSSFESRSSFFRHIASVLIDSFMNLSLESFTDIWAVLKYSMVEIPYQNSASRNTVKKHLCQSDCNLFSPKQLFTVLVSWSECPPNDLSAFWRGSRVCSISFLAVWIMSSMLCYGLILSWQKYVYSSFTPFGRRAFSSFFFIFFIQDNSCLFQTEPFWHY